MGWLYRRDATYGTVTLPQFRMHDNGSPAAGIKTNPCRYIHADSIVTQESDEKKHRTRLKKHRGIGGADWGNGYSEVFIRVEGFS